MTAQATMEIVVPQVGEAVSEVTLIEWFKREGDTVKKGEPLFEVDTDKAVVEVEAFADGTLVEILVPDNSSVMPQQVVGTLAPANIGHDASTARVSSSGIESDLVVANHKASPVTRHVADDLGISLESLAGATPGSPLRAEDVRLVARQQPKSTSVADDKNRTTRILAYPKARRLAREIGVDLANVTGTGLNGLITSRDVDAASGAMADGSVEQEVATPITTLPMDTVETLSTIRQTIANRMQASKQTVPHFYLLAEVDMRQTQQLRAYCRHILGWDQPPTYTNIVTRACALALGELPEVNVFFTDTGLSKRSTIDIGLAINTERGLIVPTLPHAEQLTLKQTMTQTQALIERARQGRLHELDLTPRSLVISNLGMYGVAAFLAIIDMPDPMILAMGQVADRVVAIDGRPAVRPMCTLTLSVDHRALDGVQGAAFLGQVKQVLENPFEIMGK